MGSIQCHICKKPAENEMEMKEDMIIRNINNNLSVRTDQKSSILDVENDNEKSYDVSKNQNNLRNFNGGVEEDVEAENNFKLISENQNQNLLSNTPKGSKVASKSYVNTSNTHSNAPLEIINEINAELSKDSHRDNDFERMVKEKEIMLDGDMKPEMIKISEETNKRQSVKDNTNLVNVNENDGPSAKKETESKRKSYLGKLVKKVQNSKDMNDAWRNMNITQIIPENKLLNSDEDEMLFQGELFKYTLPAPNQHAAQPYSAKFCVVSRTEFRVYRSKETFLRIQNPIQKVPFFSIVSTNKIQIPPTKDKKKYFNFFLELIALKESPNTPVVNSKSRKVSKIPQIMSDSHNKSGVKSASKMDESVDSTENSTKKRVKRMSMLDDKLEDDSAKIKNEPNLSNPNILVFGAVNEDTANKWLCVINYFLSK